MDVNYTGSHARCQPTRNTLVPVDLNYLNSELCRSDVGTLHISKLKENWQHMMVKFLRVKEEKRKKKLIPLCQDMNHTRSLMINGREQSTQKKHRCTAVHPRYQQRESWRSPKSCVRMCVCIERKKKKKTAVSLADRLWAELESRTFFSCNNAITRPGAADAGERTQQPRHAKYLQGWTSFCPVMHAQTCVVRE